jgi:exopolysaccharide biosynthesis polyprenyl glycosylphosphotransferase
MFDERSEALTRAATLLDGVLTVAAFGAAFWLRAFFIPDDPADFWSHAALLPLIAWLWFVFLGISGAYRSPRMTSRLAYAWSVTRAVAGGLAVLLTLLYLFKIHYVSRAIVVAFAGLDVVLLVAVRLGIVWYFRNAIRRGESVRHVLIVGSGTRAKRLAETLAEHAEWGLHIVGYLDPDPTRIGMRVAGASVLGTMDDISATLKAHIIDEVILAVPRAMIPNVDKIADACEEEGVKLRLMADVFEVHVARMTLIELGTIPLLTIEPVAQEGWKLLVKRLLDFSVALLALPVVLPVMGLCALAIRLDSPGPALFVQERVGLKKRRFRMLKFRTMIDGADRLQAQLEHLNEAQGPIFKMANDPRVTRVGRFLRRTSLDELPQVLHVFTGKMSLVGPRPMSLRDVELFDQGIQRKRFSVKPGLTCLWQISGRSQLPFSKWLELDLYYIEHWSLSLDLKILLKTVPVVLRGTGAL